MVLTEISVLPNETLEAILSFFCTETLETTLSQVCTRWKALTDTMIESRLSMTHLRKGFPETLAELRTEFSVGDDLVSLKAFERRFVSSGLQVQMQNYRGDLPARIAMSMFPPSARTTTATMFPMYGSRFFPAPPVAYSPAYTFHQFLLLENCPLCRCCCRCRSTNELQIQTKPFKYMPCYQLVCLLQNQEIFFYHVSEVTRSDFKAFYQPYIVYCREPYFAGSFDTYHDKLAVVPTQIYDQVHVFQMTKVSHEEQVLTLVFLQRIQFPSTNIYNLALFKNKVYILSRTYRLSVGQWQEQDDKGNGYDKSEVLTSQQELVNRPIETGLFPETNPIGPMCRVNNLLFFRVMQHPNIRQRGVYSTLWYVLDMNDNSLEAWKVPMKKILPMMTTLSSKPDVLGLKVSMNVLLFHYREKGDDKPGAVLSVRMKSDPRKEDFLDLSKFKQLVDMTSISSSTFNIELKSFESIPASWCGTNSPTFLGVTNALSDRNLAVLDVTTLTLSDSVDKPNTGVYIG